MSTWDLMQAVYSAIPAWVSVLLLVAALALVAAFLWTTRWRP